MPHEEQYDEYRDFDVKYTTRFTCCTGVINSKQEIATTFVHLIQAIEDDDGEHNIDVEDAHENGENPTHPTCPEVVITGIQKQGKAKRCGYLSHNASDDPDGTNRIRIYKKRTTYSSTGTEDSGQYINGPAILVQESDFADEDNESCVQECTQSPEGDGTCSLPAATCEGWYNSDDGKYYTTRIETSTGVTTSSNGFTVEEVTPLVIHRVKSFSSEDGCQTSFDYEDQGSISWEYDLDDTDCTSFGSYPDGSNIGSFINTVVGQHSGTEDGNSGDAQGAGNIGPTAVYYEDIVTYNYKEYYPSQTNPSGDCSGTASVDEDIDLDLTANFQFDNTYTYQEPLDVVTGLEVPGSDPDNPRVAIPPAGESYTSQGYVPSGTLFYENGVTVEESIEELKSTADWTGSVSDSNGNVQLAYNENSLDAGFADSRGSYETSYREARYAILVKNLVKDFEYKVFVPTYSVTNTFGSSETSYSILNGVTETFTANNLFHIVGGSLNSGITDEEFIDREYSLDPDDYPNIVKIHEDNDHSEQVIVPSQTSIVGPADGEFTAGTIYHIGNNIRIDENQGSYKYITRLPNYSSNHYDMS